MMRKRREDSRLQGRANDSPGGPKPPMTVQEDGGELSAAGKERQRQRGEKITEEDPGPTAGSTFDIFALLAIIYTTDRK